MVIGTIQPPHNSQWVTGRRHSLVGLSFVSKMIPNVIIHNHNDIQLYVHTGNRQNNRDRLHVKLEILTNDLVGMIEVSQGHVGYR